MGRPRTLWLAMAGLTALGTLAACSSSGTTSGSASDAAAGSGSSSSSSSGSSSGGTITIGATLPLTGSAASFGVEAEGGMNIALAQINAAGGVDGHKLAIDYEDDQLIPATAATDMQDLAGKGISVVLTAGSSIVEAELPAAAQHNMLLVNVAAQDDIFLTNPHYFTFIPTNDEELGKLAALVYTQRHLTKVAVIHSDDAYGASASAAFISGYEALGGSITDEEEHPEGTTDYSTYLIKIRASNPQGLVILSNTGEIGHIIAQSRQLGLDVPLFGADSALSPGDIATAGAAMDGVEGVSVNFSPSSSAAAAAFANTFMQQNKVPANSYAAICYITVNELAKAIGSAGGENPSKISAYLHSITSVPTILGDATAVPGKPVISYPIYEWLYTGGAVTALKS
jgi:branched-chain amino acid transport system substrate-binding protein